MQTRKKLKSKWLQELAPEDAALLDFKIETDYGSRILNNFGAHVQTDITRVSNFLYLKYGIKWDRLYTAYTAEYNPIWNVDGSITETETRDLATDHTGTDTTGSSGTDTQKHTGTESISDSGTDSESRSGTDRKETTGNVYGFDSSGAVPSDSGTETVTAGIGTATTYGKTEENTKNLTDSTTYGRTDTTTHNTKDTDKGTITRLTTRGGNIGVTMTQQMLEADSAYWNKVTSLFYHQVIIDIVNEITYKISPVENY